MAKNDDGGVAALVQQELDRRDKEAKRKKDPETMADLIDRIADAVVEKLTLGSEEEEEEEEERPPLAEHALFGPIFGRKGA